MEDTPPRSAAVLMLLFDRDGETYVVLTRRTETVATHKGQISFPGGMREPEDASLLETALRETQEELGIEPDQVQIVGRLAEVPTVASNFTVAPFVGYLTTAPDYRPYTREVAEVIEVPLSALRDPTSITEQEVEASDGWRQVQGFRYGQHFIWGATARILMHFLAQSGTESSPF